ncbi:MAG: Ig domain-containing protein [Desulfobacterales bacterium]|nr:Ig domain-containing protein [Desulfobacterales bacterium]
MIRKKLNTSALIATLAIFLGSTATASAGSMIHKRMAGPESRAVVNVGGGVEAINDRAAVRVEGDATFYSKNRRMGLRIDASNLTSEDRREFTKALLTLGFKLPDESLLVLSAGHLNRFHEDNFGAGIGEKGDKIDQSVFGLKFIHKLSPLTAAYLTALNFNTDSELVHTNQLVRNNTLILKGHGFGGGNQTDVLIGVETSADKLEFELAGGIQRKKYESFIGNEESRRFNLKVRTKLSVFPNEKTKLSFAADVAPDQKGLSVEFNQALRGPWSFMVRADMVHRDKSDNDEQFFLGFNRSFGGKARIARKSPGMMMGSAMNKKHWLKPVNGADSEHLQVVRTLQGVLKTITTAPKPKDMPTNGGGAAELPVLKVGDEQNWNGNIAGLFTAGDDPIVRYEFVPGGTPLPSWVSPVIDKSGRIRLLGPAQPGKTTLRVRAVSQEGLVSAPVSICITAVDAPVLTDPTPVAVRSVASSNSNMIVKINENLAPRFKNIHGGITFTKVSGPSWLSIDPKTGLLSGTPGVSDGGYYGEGPVPNGYKPYGPIRIKGTNAAGESEELVINITVNGPPVAKEGQLTADTSGNPRTGGCFTFRRRVANTITHYTNGDSSHIHLQLVSSIPGTSIVTSSRERIDFIQIDSCTLPNGVNHITTRAGNRFGVNSEILTFSLDNQTR